MKRHVVLALLSTEVNFLKAWLISLACIPIVAIPMSPSSSAFGTRAATESTTITSRALDRARVSQIVNASSPLSGCETSKSSRFTPSFRAYPGSRACSASIKAAVPPTFWALAITCSMTVVLPEDSGPYISTIRPRGKPPTPSARSIDKAPVGMTSIFFWEGALPRRMILPSPKVLVMD